jgi:hypothetical protein
MARLMVACSMICLTIVAAGLLIGGRYTIAAVHQGNNFGGLVYVLDRFTAEMRACDRTGCTKVY